MKPIVWTPKFVEVSKIKPTPNNYKIKTDLGKKRLQMSLNKFGLAGTTILNTDYTLIDGNSRVDEAKEKKIKKIWVSMPNRKLSQKEFVEMSAMFDFAKAGEVDITRIEQDLGTTSDFFNAWGMEVPLHLLEKVGKAAQSNVNLAKLAYPEDVKDAIAKGENIVMVNLFFNAKQEAEFRKIEERMQKKYKTKDTTQTVFKVFKSL